MKYSELKREFNVLIDVAGDSVISDQARFDELVAQHCYLYSHAEYFIGVKVSYQVKDRVIEPLYVANPIVMIDGAYFAVTVPSAEIERIHKELFDRWKNGDEEFEAVFPSENLYKRD